jgi:NitT/TauT family transport system ATP-binding protein
MMMKRKVELRNVSQRFPTAAKGTNGTLALDAVDLHVNEQEIVSLVGPSGCGKSTILNLIAGFATPTSGEILVDGKRVAGIEPDRLVVFQSPTLFPWLSVMDNVTFGPRMRGVAAAAYKPLAEKVIADVGLARFRGHFPYQLSGGMKQRAQIARALINRPEVLLLDEPFGALDAQTRLEMQELLLSIWDQYRCTIIFITHDVEEALFLSDRTYILSPHPGRIYREVVVPFGRPRTLALFGDSTFSQLKAEILGALHRKSPHDGHAEDVRTGEDEKDLSVSRLPKVRGAR